MYVIEYTFKPIFLYVLMVAIMNISILQWTIMMKKSLIDSLTFMSINVVCNNKSIPIIESVNSTITSLHFTNSPFLELFSTTDQCFQRDFSFEWLNRGTLVKERLRDDSLLKEVWPHINFLALVNQFAELLSTAKNWLMMKMIMKMNRSFVHIFSHEVKIYNNEKRKEISKTDKRFSFDKFFKFFCLFLFY